MASKEISVFQRLSEIDVSHMTERKGQFTYLSWTHAWKAVKDNYPDAVFVKTVYTDNQNNQLPFMRDTKGNTWVGVAVSIEGITVEEVFPVTDNRNKAMTFPDSFAVNTAHQRCLTKALAYHGLGINVYAGEDLPMETSNVEDLDEFRQKSIQFIAEIKKAKDEKALDAIAKKIKEAKLPASLKGNVETTFRNKRSQLKDKAS
ncbi:single strand annealing protein [uncultured Mediterranean phage uvMED]|nr:single strand annealing protein [uncultured Mediterranean phage uvMED]BAQ87188.1 single strand annealing protein [uncultured Mediterranean phage uvMED]BAQ87261.1 single strand annealing protein [uncultured Mediterranean phage uvMED]BAQ87330.1 single strand annealing protein [uncultured Mediterranean phage uvMED]BAQ87396.1 single strand annealing protein [uncultured Mediterranean phage uvMED]